MSAQFPAETTDAMYKMVIHIFYETEESRKGNTELNKNHNTTKLLSTLVLPLPNSIQDSQGHNWSEYSITNSLQEYTNGASSLSNFGGKAGKALNLISSIASSATNILNTDSIINKISRRSTGTGLDPNFRLEYTGESLREFRFNFTFIPESKKDTEQLLKIIKELRKYGTGSKTHQSTDNSLMSVSDTISGMLSSTGLAINAFISEPASFMINFQSNSSKNSVINDMFRPIKLVLTSMDTSLFEGGFASLFEDGAPKQVSLSLIFREQYPLYSEDWK